MDTNRKRNGVLPNGGADGGAAAAAAAAAALAAAVGGSYKDIGPLEPLL